MSQRRALGLLVAALVVAHVAVAVWVGSADRWRSDTHRMRSDVANFQRLAAEDGVPYRDFEIEYPPLTYLAAEALHSSDYETMLVRLVVSQLALDLACAALVGFGWGRRATVSYLLVALPILRLELVRLDLLSVVLALGAMVLVQRKREVLGGVALAGGALAKLWPAALIPTIAGAGKVRGAVAAVVSGGIGLVTWAAVGGIDGVRQVIGFRGAKGWQVESLPGTLFLLVRESQLRYEAGTYRVGESPAWVAWCFLLVAAAVVITVAILLERSRRDGLLVDEAATPAVVAIAATMLGASVLSPQFLIWLVPFAAIAGAQRDYVSEALVAVAVGITALILIEYSPVESNLSIPHAAYLFRNLVLVVVVVVGLRRLVRARTTLRVASPA